MPRAVVVIAILLAAFVLVACGKQDPRTAAIETTDPAAPAPATATTTRPEVKPRSARDGCKAVPAPEPAAQPNRRRSRQKLSPKRTYTAILRTNCGTIRIRLDVKNSPKTTASFAGLARNGFYDGLTFHRIAKPGGNDYVIQGGDPLGTGNGGPGYTVIEKPPGDTRYRRYDVGMAKAEGEQQGTSGSQFFIVTAAEAPLPPDYAVLGRVTSGQKVVRRIARLATDPATEMPIDPVVISSVRVVSSPR
ncbi:MAG: peptidylprolyl isomerase [Actinobacteria bacterium]|nr:peptidylprolyl isomerase [Actinomycetota bacterium]